MSCRLKPDRMMALSNARDYVIEIVDRSILPSWSFSLSTPAVFN